MTRLLPSMTCAVTMFVAVGAYAQGDVGSEAEDAELLRDASTSHGDAVPQEEASNSALARSLFHDGVRCLDLGDLECASDRFERSRALRPSPVVDYNLASAEMGRGHFIIASELLRTVSRDRGAPTEVQAAAAALLARARARLAHLRVIAPSDARIEIDGRLLPRQALGVFAPVDPGTRDIRASLHGRALGEESVTLREGGQATVRFQDPPSPEAVALADRAAQQHAAENGARVGADRSVHVRRRRAGITAAAVAVLVSVIVVAVAVRPGSQSPLPGDLPPVYIE